MKKIIPYITFIFLLSFFVVTESKAQCDAAGLAQACVPKLQEGFTFLKSFKVDGQGGAKAKVEYSYVFSKDAQYLLNICAGGNGPTDGIKVTMYDSNRQIVATNFNAGKFYDSFTYPCNATGIYYITFTFEGSTTHCAGSVLGFKR